MATERSAQQREPLDLDGLITALREWADKIEGDPSSNRVIARRGCKIRPEPMSRRGRGAWPRPLVSWRASGWRPIRGRRGRARCRR